MYTPVSPVAPQWHQTGHQDPHLAICMHGMGVFVCIYNIYQFVHVWQTYPCMYCTCKLWELSPIKLSSYVVGRLAPHEPARIKRYVGAKHSSMKYWHLLNKHLTNGTVCPWVRGLYPYSKIGTKRIDICLAIVNDLHFAFARVGHRACVFKVLRNKDKSQVEL